MGGTQGYHALAPCEDQHSSGATRSLSGNPKGQKASISMGLCARNTGVATALSSGVTPPKGSGRHEVAARTWTGGQRAASPKAGSAAGWGAGPHCPSAQLVGLGEIEDMTCQDWGAGQLWGATAHSRPGDPRPAPRSWSRSRVSSTCQGPAGSLGDPRPGCRLGLNRAGCCWGLLMDGATFPSWLGHPPPRHLAIQAQGKGHLTWAVRS